VVLASVTVFVIRTRKSFLRANPKAIFFIDNPTGGCGDDRLGGNEPGPLSASICKNLLPNENDWFGLAGVLT